MDYLENGRLVSTVLAIRYRANFSVVDNFGSILDEILYSKGSFFNQSFFPIVHHTKADEKILANHQTNNVMRINSSNVILDIDLPEEDSDTFRERAISAFNDQIVRGVLLKKKIVQINRIGCVNRFIFPDQVLASNFINKTIGATLNNVNDINLRFSRKHPIPDSMVKKDVFDYHNAIFTVIKKSDQDEIFFSVDYQRYYEPFLESTTLVDFPAFIDKAEYYNKEIFLEWIKENYRG